MVGAMELRSALIAKTLRVPAIDGPAGDGGTVARRLDVALLSVGFKCSRELLDHLSGLHPVVAQEAGEAALGAVRELVGDHVRHNAYFIDFPANVPDTLAFWAELRRRKGCAIRARPATSPASSRRVWSTCSICRPTGAISTPTRSCWRHTTS